MSKRANLPYVFAVLAVVVVVLVFRFFVGGGVRALEAEARTQNQQITTLQNQIATRQTELNRQQATVSVDAVSVDESRVAKDDVMAREFIAKVVTWRGTEEYDVLREQAMEAYHLNEGDRFVKTLLPRYGIRTEQAGFASDAVVVSELESMKSMVCDVVGDKYSYFTVVSTTVGSDGASANVVFAVMYSVDSLGNFSGLSAYELT